MTSIPDAEKDMICRAIVGCAMDLMFPNRTFPDPARASERLSDIICAQTEAVRMIVATLTGPRTPVSESDQAVITLLERNLIEFKAHVRGMH